MTTPTTEHRITIQENHLGAYWCTCTCGWTSERTTTLDDAMQLGIAHGENPGG